jgi:hypothetical protein
MAGATFRQKEAETPVPCSESTDHTRISSEEIIFPMELFRPPPRPTDERDTSAKSSIAGASMSSTPNPAGADGARQSVRAVVVPHEYCEESVPLSRIGPAGLASIVFHAILLAAFIVLAPSGQALGPTEKTIDLSVDVAAEDEVHKPDFRSTDVNPNITHFEGEISYTIRRKDEISIPFQLSPEEAIGRPDGNLNNIPESVVPLPGRGIGFGGPAPVPGTGPGRDMLTDPGGEGPIGPLMNPLKGRSGSTKEFLLQKGFGSPASEAAVTKGLLWLARVQSPSGVWKLDGNFPNKGGAPNDAAATALGLLPFLGAGFTHKTAKDNLYDKTIDKALRALIAMQDKRTGAFSRDMYAHGLATIAMSEAFSLSQDYSLKRPTQLALNHIVAAQHEGGGWRYSAGQAGDTSVSGWQIMALKSGLMAGFDIPSSTLRKAQTFLDSVAQSSTEGSGYTDPNLPTPTMTAVSLLCRQYISGWGRQNLRLIKAVDNYIKPKPPQPDKKDVYYYYYATQVMHNLGGDDWKAWNAKMRDQLIASQDNDAKLPLTYGSWSPVGDQWGETGGRLMVTSLNLLTLEVYYRYLPLYYREKS